MATYSKITDFAAKDALLTGNPSKIVKGTEIGAEFDSIATADASNVKGPTSSVTDNAVVRWDTTTGRISQGSSVTIDDSGNISGTSFTGAHNGTVGATTPSTGAFTTLSATGEITTPLRYSLNTYPVMNYTGGYVQFGDLNNNIGGLKLFANGSAIATVSNTGLSVTGALSATNGISETSGTVGVTSANGGGTARMIGVASGAFFGSTTAVDTVIQRNSSEIGRFSATGLAVTGALSATNNVTTTGTGTTAAFVANNGTINAQLGNDSVGGLVGTASNHSLGLYTNGTKQATIDTSGNLGLGVTLSAWGTYTGVLESKYGSHLATFTDQLVLGLNSYFNGSSWIYKNNNYATRYYQNSGAHSWYTAPSGTAGNAITFTQSMTLDASGNLLVNVASVFNSCKFGLVFDGATQNGFGYKLSANTSGASFGLFLDNSGNVCGSISRVTTTSAVTYNTTSDYRLKTVIAPVSGAGARIDALNPVEYEWKENGTVSRGFLAHEFQSVYAQSVQGEKDEVDAEGNPKYQSMQAGSAEVIADLVAEIKSLRARIAALEAV